MSNIFSDRISDVPKSFIREILKVTEDKEIISFAGGLPNRNYFPVKEIKNASCKILDEDGGSILQYSTTEGYHGLRQWIANRYKIKKGIDIQPKNILITSGSQQGLDLLGKTFLNEGDHVIIEEPGYLGAIQAFSVYKSSFHPVVLNNDGIDIKQLKTAIENYPIKLYYSVPNFQNPSGITYSNDNRKNASEILKGKDTLLIEDDPYGELRFIGEDKTSFYKFIPENTVLLGSFSKIVAPSFRIGWIVANDYIMDKLVVAKQATDLHTNYFGQRVIYQYLMDNDIDEHISIIKEVYGRQRDSMVKSIKEYFPSNVKITEPEGGMFLWATFPEGISALSLFNECVKEKVVFVPGDPFYVNKTNVNTCRLNYSCVDEETIKLGIKKMGKVLKSMV